MENQDTKKVQRRWKEKIEQEVQKKWKEESVFEFDAPNKYFVTIQWPFKSTEMCLEHAYFISKAEFALGYQRLKGKQCLFSFTYQGTEVTKDYCDKVESDLMSLGISIDWRRSFTTSDKDEFYSSFKKWYQWRLKENIKTKKVPAIYSCEASRPVMDHDRSTGLGVKPQEYILVKMKATEPFPKALENLSGQSVFLVAAELRPEILYGLSNCWINPDMTYIAFKTTPGEIFICNEHSFANMKCQEFTSEENTEPLLTFKGNDVLGLSLRAPMISKTIYALPWSGIEENKGTGIVASVPAEDSKHDGALKSLQKTVSQYPSLTQEMVPTVIEHEPVVTVLDTEPETGKDQSESLDGSQNKKKRKKTPKNKAFHDSYYKGEMAVGEYKGMKVKEAREKIKQNLIDKNEATLYYEPESEVLYGGKKCVVAQCNVEYFDFGEDNVEEIFDGLKGYTSYKTIHWDHPAISMAYCIVAHKLQQEPKIEAEQMTPEIWDFIFRGGRLPQSPISPEKLKTLHHEFVYWNWPILNDSVCQWPPNGVLVAGNKFKPKTNEKNLREIIDQNSVDVIRCALAKCGDKLPDDIYNVLKEEEKHVLPPLRSHIDWIKNIKKERDVPETEYTYYDMVFNNNMNRVVKLCEEAYKSFKYQDVIKAVFSDLHDAKSHYFAVTSDGLNWQLLQKFIKVQAIILSPICPHFCEHVWKQIIGSSTSIGIARWPEGVVKTELIHEANYITAIENRYRKYIRKKKIKTQHIEIYVAKDYLDWQKEILACIKNWHSKNQKFPSIKDIRPLTGQPLTKDHVNFIHHIRELFDNLGKNALEPTVPYNELSILRKNKVGLVRMLQLDGLQLGELQDKDNPQKEFSPGIPKLKFGRTEQQETCLSCSLLRLK